MRSNNPMISPRNSLTLQISGPNGQRMESIGELESLIIGSGPEARIQIEDSAVSSLHLLMKRDREGTVRAIDTGQRGWNPALGLSRSWAGRALTSGDVLRIGNTRIKVAGWVGYQGHRFRGWRLCRDRSGGPGQGDP